MMVLGLAGAFLSVALFLEPCDKEVETTATTTNTTANVTRTTNTTANVTVVYNASVLLNVTENVTFFANETVFSNATYNVSQLVNATVNVTTVHNVTTVRNVTTVVNATTVRNVTTVSVARQDVDAVSMLDTSGSMSASDFKEGLEATRTIFSTLLGSLNSTLAVGLGKWGTGHVVETPLARVENASQIAALNMTRDTEWTFYAHALLGCLDEFEARGRNGSFQLCQISMDGGIFDDNVFYDGVDDTPERMRPNWLAGDAEYVVGDTWDGGDVFAACVRLGLDECSVWTLSRYMKDVLGIKIMNVLVGTFDDFPVAVDESYALSSCDGGNTTDCPYTVEVESFDELKAAAARIAESIASEVTATTVAVTTREATETTERLATSERVTARETAVETSRRVEARVRLVAGTIRETRMTPTTRAVTSVEAAVREESATTRTISASRETRKETKKEDHVSRRTVCTGSGVSFGFMGLALPLLLYLFLKPACNVLANCCCPESGDEGDDRDSDVEMFANPAFGLEKPTGDVASPSRGDRERDRVDMTLHKRDHHPKKKTHFFGARDDGPEPRRTARPSAGHDPRRRRRRDRLGQRLRDDLRRRRLAGGRRRLGRRPGLLLPRRQAPPHLRQQGHRRARGPGDRRRPQRRGAPLDDDRSLPRPPPPPAPV